MDFKEKVFQIVLACVLVALVVAGIFAFCAMKKAVEKSVSSYTIDYMNIL